MTGMVLTPEALDDNSRYFGWSGDPNKIGNNNENPELTARSVDGKYSFAIRNHIL